ncbi:cytochrome C551 [Paenibacillus sp. DMB20]|nr:cytochrome C551 [Paenibacillus sp. DMB20]
MAVLAVIFLGACNPKAVDEPALQATISSPEDEEAAALYRSQCISCHAADLSGKVGPNLQNIGSNITEEKINEIIRDGSKGMPSFNKLLEDNEIQILVQWLAKMK